MKSWKSLFIFILVFSVCVTSCISAKKNPLYDSEWIMHNVDKDNLPYVHQLFLKPDYSVTLQVHYVNSDKVLVWTGTYKLKSKKIIFDFKECVRFENKQAVGRYTAGQFIKYYTGEFFYSVGLVEDADLQKRYHLQLIRPVNYFYGENVDIFQNPLEEFVKVK